MYLLDTTIPSELRKGLRGNLNVLQWVRRTPADLQYISVMTILELRLGALQKEKSDPAQAMALHRWIDESVLTGFRGRILPVSIEAAERCAALHIPTMRDDRDMLIASTALVHQFTVVTRNVRHFEPTGVPILNP